MAIEETLYSRLAGYSALADLVTTGSNIRISPNRKKQDTALPAVTFERVSTQRFSAMSVDSNVIKARFQVDVWAATYSSASAVRDQVIAALQRWKNTSGTTVFDTFILTENDLYEDDIDQHHIAIDIEINYSTS
jgi:hypothetical protein